MPNRFLKWLYQVILLPVVFEIFNCFVFLLILDIICLWHFSRYPYLGVSHLWIQPTTDRKYAEKNFQSSKEESHPGNYLHTIYVVLGIKCNLKMLYMEEKKVYRQLCVSYIQIFHLCKDFNIYRGPGTIPLWILGDDCLCASLCLYQIVLLIIVL